MERKASYTERKHKLRKASSISTVKRVYGVSPRKTSKINLGLKLKPTNRPFTLALKSRPTIVNPLNLQSTRRCPSNHSSQQFNKKSLNPAELKNLPFSPINRNSSSTVNDSILQLLKSLDK